MEGSSLQGLSLSSRQSFGWSGWKESLPHLSKPATQVGRGGVSWIGQNPDPCRATRLCTQHTLLCFSSTCFIPCRRGEVSPEAGGSASAANGGMQALVFTGDLVRGVLGRVLRF